MDYLWGESQPKLTEEQKQEVIENRKANQKQRWKLYAEKHKILMKESEEYRQKHLERKKNWRDKRSARLQGLQLSDEYRQRRKEIEKRC